MDYFVAAFLIVGNNAEDREAIATLSSKKEGPWKEAAEKAASLLIEVRRASIDLKEVEKSWKEKLEEFSFQGAWKDMGLLCLLQVTLQEAELRAWHALNSIHIAKKAIWMECPDQNYSEFNMDFLPGIRREMEEAKALAARAAQDD